MSRRDSRKEYIAAQEREARERWERINAVWQVPDHAAESFIALEDAVGESKAAAIANFVKTMMKID
jgi:hypothetical protein